MIPEIEFRCNGTYDQFCREKYTKAEEKKLGKYPTNKKTMAYIKKIQPLWKKDGKKILLELQKVTGLKWKEKKMICYVVGNHIPFADPLTIPVFAKNPDYFTDVLTHELVHNLLNQNDEKLSKYWNFVWKKYPKNSFVTKVHLVVHAIHKHIFLKFYDEKRLRR